MTILTLLDGANCWYKFSSQGPTSHGCLIPIPYGRLHGDVDQPSGLSSFPIVLRIFVWTKIDVGEVTPITFIITWLRRLIQVRDPIQVILARAEFSPLCVVTLGSAPLDGRDSPCSTGPVAGKGRALSAC